MLKYIKNKITEYRQKRLKKQIVATTRKVLSLEPDSERESPGLQTAIWQLSDARTLVRSRMLRGDLIEVVNNDTVLMSWVDQSHTYDGMLGINDVFFGWMDNIEMQLVLQLLKDKVYVCKESIK